MHGIEVLQFVRAHRKYHDLPIVVLTTRGDEESRSEAYASGATDYLTKPFQAENCSPTPAGFLSPDNVEPEFRQHRNFREQFSRGLLPECEEHLFLVRRHVLAIEAQIGAGSIDVGLLDELFRSFHTIKGISGMVGFTEVEQLAHSIESMLRSLRQPN
jgi:CheY-like chemotaxis protein